jgi:ABC-type sugar transport system ATPase subunit
MSVADRLAVLYLGSLAAVGPKDQFDAQVVVDLMTTGTSQRLSERGRAEQPATGGS